MRPKPARPDDRATPVRPSVDRSPDAAQRIVLFGSHEAEHNGRRSVSASLYHAAMLLRRGADHGRELIQQGVKPFGVELVRRATSDRDLRAEHGHGLARRDRLEARRSGNCKHGGLPENLLLEGAQLIRRVDAEPVQERAPRFPTCLESSRLAAGAIESERELAPKPLVERVGCHERRELGQNLGVQAERELRVEEVVLCVQAQVDRGEEDASAANGSNARSASAAPRQQCKGGAQSLRTRCRVARRTRLPGQELELAQVYLLAGHHDRVPGCPGDEETGGSTFRTWDTTF